MYTEKKYSFIEIKDDKALLINDRANQLYQKLLLLDISDSDIDEFGQSYFTSHHTGHRLFFSIQSSADIIYQSVKKINKPFSEISFMDYGAGLGTLFLLAGTVGFKKVYFNDYFPQWAGYAKIICQKLHIQVDDFISGDIDAVIDHGKKHGCTFDIVASRNVVEHIYKLRDFYSKLYRSGLCTICFSTTTANYHNPVMRLKHYWQHYSAEKRAYKKQRTERIKEQVPEIIICDLNKLIELTRGKAFDDFTKAVDLYFKKQPIPAVEFLGTNTCDCETGVWAENLITRKSYFDIINKAGFETNYTPGFWDTHYKYKVVNLFTALLNHLIKICGSKGIWFAPFVNVVACKK